MNLRPEIQARGGPRRPAARFPAKRAGFPAGPRALWNPMAIPALSFFPLNLFSLLRRLFNPFPHPRAMAGCSIFGTAEIPGIPGKKELRAAMLLSYFRSPLRSGK
ncbi:MAG: hypothetical protein LBJ82_05370 [Deltaproteobacteria bacterium]|jgi:hypothetical protein|nr:hypothetical protein [Deltaproteobacteria bacterium]